MCLASQLEFKPLDTSWNKSIVTDSLRRQLPLLRLASYDLLVESTCRKDILPKLSRPSQSKAYGSRWM